MERRRRCDDARDVRAPMRKMRNGSEREVAMHANLSRGAVRHPSFERFAEETRRKIASPTG
jgi:hypothetical protein